jgi:uncharacterized protein (TIGR03437 family)
VLQTRQLGVALLAGLLLGLIPGAAAAGGMAGTSSSVEVQTPLSPDAVFAAFESNLAGPAVGRRIATHPAALERVLPGPELPGTYQVAAALAQETSAVFQASLTDSTPRALTPPSLSVTPEAISLSATVGEAPVRRRLDIASLGGTVNWGARARILNGENWLRVLPENGVVAAGTPVPLGVEIDYNALGTAPGLFQGLIQVIDQATGFVETVPVAVVLNTQQSRIGLSENSIHLTIAGGGAAPPPQTLRIFNRGGGTLNWRILASLLPPWLDVSLTSGSAGGTFAQSSPVTLAVNGPAALALPSGVYQILVPIEATEANNSPQLVTVTLQRVPGSTPPSPGIRPGGLVFVARQGGAAPAPKSFTVSNRGGGSLNALFNASTAAGGDWLRVGATGGTITSASGPLTIPVTVNPANLPRGLYRGTIRAAFSAGERLDADVLLIVTPASAAARFSLPPSPALEGCTPDLMELVAETIGNGVSVPISFPRVLLVSVIDSCAEPVEEATVVASVEQTTIPMQALGNGTYSGTWVPREQSSAVPVTFTALHSTLPPVSRTFQVSTEPAAEGIQLPVLATNGVVEGAGFTSNRPLAPGGFISLFGSRFTTQAAGATQIPLERELGGVRVRVGNVDAPLHFVSPGQVNAVLPVEARPGAGVSIVVSANGRLTAPQTYLVAPAMPGIFINDAGVPAIRRFVSAGQPSQPVTPENPARIGDILEIFATGLGETDPPVASGDALQTASTVLNPVSVEIGGIGVPVLYQGLAPGFVGLYQVNVSVPDSVPIGDGLQIRLIQNGIVGNPDNPATIRVVPQ